MTSTVLRDAGICVAAQVLRARLRSIRLSGRWETWSQKISDKRVGNDLDVPSGRGFFASHPGIRASPLSVHRDKPIRLSKGLALRWRSRVETLG